jgi:hypothetical protein
MIPRWITQKINASKQRIRHDLAQGKGASTLEVTRILRIVWFFYSLVRPANPPFDQPYYEFNLLALCAQVLGEQ